MSHENLKGEIFYPSDEAVKNARVPDWDALAEEADQDYIGFWEREAKELHWFERGPKCWTIRKSRFTNGSWGAKTNIVYNCLDRHVQDRATQQMALIWEGENGDFRSFSYFAMRREVCRFANVLRSLGLVKGDRVTIYMGRIPELPIAMLACACIGAIHSVVFGGFTVEALAERIEDSQSKVLITCDGALQRGKIVPLKQIADEALQRPGRSKACWSSGAPGMKSTWKKGGTCGTTS